MINQRPKAFLSYSHADRDIATQLAEGLRTNGIEVWFDKWEILPGDSLVERIFKEGLAGADVFILLLSQSSMQSRWVQEELDVALIKRIEGVTRVIPVVVDDVKVPLSLRGLLWVDMSNGLDETLRKLQMAIFGVRERPSVGQPPEFIRHQMASVGGLSRIATRLGLFLASTGKHEIGNEEKFRASELSDRLGFSQEETDDAIDELERLGLVETLNFFGSHPFLHGEVWPTYALFLHFREEGLEYDPEEDIKTVASTIAAKKQIGGRQIAQITELSPLRINRAVAFLEDYGLAQIIREVGTAPYNFGIAWATGPTRRFVAENCR
jgi:hypothetical protein